MVRYRHVSAVGGHFLFLDPSESPCPFHALIFVCLFACKGVVLTVLIRLSTSTTCSKAQLRQGETGKAGENQTPPRSFSSVSHFLKKKYSTIPWHILLQYSLLHLLLPSMTSSRDFQDQQGMHLESVLCELVSEILELK